MSQETKKEADVLFEQPYLMGRVLKEGDKYILQFAGLGTNTMSVETSTEENGKAIYGVIEDYIKSSMQNFITELGNKLEEAQNQVES
jgi:hypothetical protein